MNLVNVFKCICGMTILCVLVDRCCVNCWPIRTDENHFKNLLKIDFNSNVGMRKINCAH